MKKLLYILVSILCLNKAEALEVRFHPGDRLYLNEANRQYNTHDLIAHLVIIKNNSNETVHLEKARYQLFAGDNVIQELHVPAEEAVKATSRLSGLKAAGMQMLLDVICPPEVLGKDGKLAATKELRPGEALTVMNVYITIQSLPTRLRVDAFAKNAKGEEAQGSTEIDVVQYKSPNKYIFPLEGDWYMQAVPNVTSHHRWMSQTEFGIDFLKLDSRGLPYKTNGKQANDFPAFGQPVLAAADGVVVTAINDSVQNWDMWVQREGETEDDFNKRAGQYQLESMKKDLNRAVAGNFVVIEHANKEYSGYAHLKTGSVKVKVGEKVRQGQQIAEVGDTGDYNQPHLHFQISNRPDVLHGRSLPFEFSNLGNKPELGHFARVKK